MGTPPRLISILFGLFAVLASIGASSAATQTETMATIVGTTECLDCAQKSIKTENAVKGLRVAINCKVSDQKYETKATGELDSNGDFNVKLPGELLGDDGQLKHDCFAQLHSTANAPCPDKNGLQNPSRLILESKEGGKHTFITASGKLAFSSATCVSATFWPCPPLSGHKKMPKYHMPSYKFPPYQPHPHPFYHSPPSYKPPPQGGGYYKPPAPQYKPPAPQYKPPTPSGGYYQPPAPEYKPPAPEYKPPSSGGYYNPPAAPQYKPSPVNYHEHFHPIYKKPMPPMPKLPPFHHEHPHHPGSFSEAKVHRKML